MSRTINLLAISGSLRVSSSNTAIIHAIAQMALKNINVKIADGLAKLPHFDPDNARGNSDVAAFRKSVQESDGIIICTPEYAFGVPGVLKNALDWSVSSGEFNEKPVCAISASPLPSGGDKALASLLLTLTALGTITDRSMTLSIGGSKKKINEQGEVTDPQTRNELGQVLTNLVATIVKHQKPAVA